MKLKRYKNMVIKWIIRFLNIIIPKNKNQIYLRSYYEYRDNIHAILDELLKNSNNNYKIYGDGTVFNEYKKQGISVVKSGSLSSLLAFFRSKYVINDGGMFYNTKPIKTQIIVNTWHGVSLKRIGYYLDDYNDCSGDATATFVVTYSQFFRNVMAYAFGVKPQRVLLTGEPRNDYFFSPVSSNPLMRLGIDKTKYKSIVIWMPTYRQNSVDSTSDGALYEFGIPLISSTNINDLDLCCNELGIILIIKWHGLQCDDNIIKNRLTNIRFLTSHEIGKAKVSLNEIVGECDCLITDYSSVYVNYLVLNRPICFAYDDIEEYKKNRGFMFDNVEEIMPGEHVNSIAELKQFLINFSEGVDLYKEDRIRVNKKLNKYSDGHNSYRLLKKLGVI